MNTRTKSSPETQEVLGKFSRATKDWFEGAFAGPTPAQLGAWDAISRKENALVIAPTGSGKTLAAFLWTLDSFIRDASANVVPELPLDLAEPGDFGAIFIARKLLFRVGAHEGRGQSRKLKAGGQHRTLNVEH
jgi:superfamily II DNA/RNA helicase